ncbi:MAG: anaerobic ribonucleotide reductase-activating protein [candidate division CPR1 bacterium ADurb.Bin160]|uniref:Anaerobic ribonucleotide reductase-activating protein n=1 Tax=candidate division CPR1 bacterium ADurb.Bin160 TaxID=1852826 RepID=A0A1V5ZL07_9BACT|nr:MAG: anaerobic ribonucleotide reductase-activating protein [candidate division CPR1 bacterium ADurb.Bin160]
MYLNVKVPFNSTFMDYFDNESMAVVIYIMGCSHNCKGCHNKQFQDFYYEKNTKMFTSIELADEIIKVARKNETDKVCFEGGDPLYPQNIHAVKDLLIRLSMNGIKTAIYTGYDIDIVKPYELNFDFIKCGTFDINQTQEVKKTDEYMSLASTNQKIYNRKYQLISENGILFF